MARNRVSTVLVRRKREAKTDYKLRLNILKSRKPRLVIRKSNKNIIAQIINYMPDGDVIEASANSKELEKMGWTFSRSNIPAAYLTGLMLSKKAKSKSAVLDLGLQKAKKNSRLYACLKGCIDGGLDIPHSDDVFPDEKRIKGNHIKDYAKIQKDSKKENIDKSFDDLKNKIIGKK